MKLMQFILAIIFISTIPAYGVVVVEDTNLSWTPDLTLPGANYRATVYQDAEADNLTSAWFHYDGISIEGITANLDEGSSWYIVQSGDVFTESNVEAGLFQPLITFGPDFHDPAFVGSDFYLGIVTLESIELDWENPTVFGWARFVGGVMVDNVMSYDSKGIIVGTSTAIPEPSSILLSVLAISGAAITRRFK